MKKQIFCLFCRKLLNLHQIDLFWIWSFYFRTFHMNVGQRRYSLQFSNCKAPKRNQTLPFCAPFVTAHTSTTNILFSFSLPPITRLLTSSPASSNPTPSTGKPICLVCLFWKRLRGDDGAAEPGRRRRRGGAAGTAEARQRFEGAALASQEMSDLPLL